MKLLYAASAIALLACAMPALAQAPMPPAPAAGPTRPNAMVEFPAKGSAKLTVTSPAFTDGGDIPYENTQYRTNTFPGLAWTKGPAGTKSYAVIMQDTCGARNGAPILHWTLYNVPVGITKLDAGMAATANPAGSSYGPGLRGASQPYNGPRTPAGPKHPYHMQVFALDTTLTADPALDYDGLVNQMKGHILADGEVVGMGSVDPTAPPPPPRPAAPPAPAPM
jgi:para-nitrobenzyl esterase